MKNRYLKSLTARVTILMLSFLWSGRKPGSWGTNPRWREGTALQPVLCRHKSPVMPRMTKAEVMLFR